MKEEGRPAQPSRGNDGFSLVESLIALLIMSFGLLAVGQLMFASIGGPTLARSKTAAATVADDKLRLLAEHYRQNPAGADLTLGSHGPEFVAVQNPNGGVLNRFSLNWTVANVPDPRAWRVLQARQLTVTVSPVREDGNANRQVSLNKVLSMTAIVSARIE
jgi:prepilin-type N-terminal cleavage/methylation domain-containing protein